MSRRRELLVLVAAGLLVVAAACVLLVRPQRQAIGQARADEGNARAESASLHDEVRALEALQADQKALRERARQARSQFPATPDLPGLIDALQRAADGAGVDLASISPGTPKPSGIRPELAEITTGLEVKGGYFEIQDFLSRLEDLVKGEGSANQPLPRSVLVRSVAISSSGGGQGGGDSASAPAASQGSSDELSATITLAVFQLATAPSGDGSAQSGPATGGAAPAEVR